MCCVHSPQNPGILRPRTQRILVQSLLWGSMSFWVVDYCNVNTGLIIPPSRSTRFEIGGIGDRPHPLNKGDDLMMDDEMIWTWCWMMVDGILCESWKFEPCVPWELWVYWHKLDKRSDRIEQRAMPIGSLHIRVWRRHRRWRLYVVRVDANTGWTRQCWILTRKKVYSINNIFRLVNYNIYFSGAAGLD